MVESDNTEERLARVERTLEQLKRQADKLAKLVQNPFSGVLKNSRNGNNGQHPPTFVARAGIRARPKA